MQPRSLRSAASVAAVVVAAAVLIGACGSNGPTGARGAPNGTGASVPPASSPATAPATEPASTPTQRPAPTQPTTTETDWGAIWDAVPADFPVPEGAEPTDANEAVSAAWAGGGRPAQITDGMVAGLKAAGWSIEAASGPFEDGSRVIDAVRGAPDCRTQVTVAPRGDQILIMVRYAAACPWQ